jgi:hypothetical protein
MPRKKSQPSDTLEALRQVRKSVPPPSRVKKDEKKYRRVTARQTLRQEIEQAEKKR